MRLVLALHCLRTSLTSNGVGHVIPDVSNVPVDAPAPGPRRPGARGTGEALRQIGWAHRPDRSHTSHPAQGAGWLFFQYEVGIHAESAQAISYPHPAAWFRGAMNGKDVRDRLLSRGCGFPEFWPYARAAVRDTVARSRSMPALEIASAARR